jgi:hypothetical protein
MLPGMSVKEPQMALLYCWGRTGYGNVGKNRKQGKDANTQTVLPLDLDRATILLA